MAAAVASLACGGCVFQQMGLTFPPTYAWCLVLPLWYLSLGIWSRSAAVPLWGVAGPLRGTLLFLVALFAGGAAAGPFPLFLFGIPSAVATVQLMRAPAGTAAADGVGKVIAILGCAILALSAGAAYFAASGPPSAERVLERASYSELWEKEFERLEAREPASLPEYRKILEKTGNPYLQSKAAVRVAALGTPEQDVPLLLDALERQSRNWSYRSTELAQALGRMTGLSLPEESKPEAWREAWAKKRAGK